ncbi:3-phosphoshikimate 1-carboxyvinyltransferase [Helicobacter winghamensis]|uniref:3-phosphoshikimate 1-carboxyvinyltransferase n=1 Tax=Helicobacter winghamensis TaxID=157268 RepID=A0A2N3PI51_9HELI|nr:3-phosphoshikimate 1-carboxyvinyltransferase [Helicobacter winghamensis]EEO26150.1 3-phosphoshikimate 1-carboxyvinyltransferase [Helicobacter winghamensis ATCC BAA-430]PKT75711.1 3-phosphoshikimate 1-carboxyvinyltransferase [Helicobacter winghamensis]PKT75920.1 3-phosphoshikimate 1-carboxyvinyltransferase [Helicobacter winghamensis]PKT76157.1 3-phosphoshikimate 1-carboxyvinyltransferase [Helicobacter winghamensis]PKT80303.1 3-phosphoshikimate 1-carboxyvinyltransferase [Helicobacter winghame
MKLEVSKTQGFELETDKIASDKSISHRCAMFALLSDKPSFVKNYLEGEDTLDTLEIAKKLGLSVEKCHGGLLLTPPKNIQEPNTILYCGNAGTAMRLYLGLLSAQNGIFVLSGDMYLNKRPMKRIVEPLRSIGAEILGRSSGEFAPLVIKGNPKLESFFYTSKIPSAQIKSAMLLSALFAKGESVYQEPELSRDHSEKMLKGMGAEIESAIDKNGAVEIKIKPLKSKLEPLNLEIPADPSSAFFFAVAVAITPNSRGILRNVLLNKTRIEAFSVLEKMGVTITYKETSKTYESIGDIIINAPESLKAVELSEKISWLIDEIPALAIAMACAKGKSVVKNAKELRVKETDRIKAVVENLRACGIEAQELDDGFYIVGGMLKKACVDSFGDHRIAMSFAVAGLKSGMEIENAECINVSFPNFLEILQSLTKICQKG